MTSNWLHRRNMRGRGRPGDCRNSLRRLRMVTPYWASVFRQLRQESFATAIVAALPSSCWMSRIDCDRLTDFAQRTFRRRRTFGDALGGPIEFQEADMAEPG